MRAGDDTLICTVCGEEILPSEPVVQTDEGGVAHVRCVRREETLGAVVRRAWV
jgi:hypothetical protein